MRIKTIVEMDYTEFQDLVDEHMPYKERFEFPDFFECNNYSAQTWDGIDGELDEMDTEGVERFMRTREQYSCGPSQILNWLCKHGHIGTGNYVITISW